MFGWLWKKKKETPLFPEYYLRMALAKNVLLTVDWWDDEKQYLQIRVWLYELKENDIECVDSGTVARKVKEKDIWPIIHEQVKLYDHEEKARHMANYKTQQLKQFINETLETGEE